MKGAPGINVTPISPAASIQGVITDVETGSPVSGATVTAYARDESVAGTAVTSPSGSYVITGLDPDYYYVGAGLPEVFYPNMTELTVAEPISAVLSGDGVGVDMQVEGNAAPIAEPVEVAAGSGLGAANDLPPPGPGGWVF